MRIPTAPFVYLLLSHVYYNVSDRCKETPGEQARASSYTYLLQGDNGRPRTCALTLIDFSHFDSSYLCFEPSLAYQQQSKQKMALDFSATYKLLVLGDSNVGKTCIVHRYCDERYYDIYISTIGE